ncbi:MAG: PorV/PorQ family protein [Bacteroidales bacterium]|nr:PorV/PorQ family protein [Bacteroidales bacterium]
MKRIYLILLISILGLVSSDLFAGNWQRAGQAGASQLLLNPWARTSGWGEAGVACVTGYESMHLNVAGLAFTKKLEVGFNNTQYLVGSGLQINAAALAIRVGENSVLGAMVNVFNWGEIEKTSEAMPEGGFGTYKPGYATIGLSYAREFSNSIFGGITIKMLNEHIDNLKSSGFAIDAGIQYITGFGKDKAGNRNRDNIHFGITMKNVGTTMKYTGDGMTFVGFSPTGTSMSVENRSQEYELPSLIKIGFSYHIRLAPKVDEEEDVVYSNHNLAIALNFTSNSFTKDQFHVGLEYSFMEYLFLRAGYTYESGIESVDKRTTWFTGPSVGITLQAPLKKREGGKSSSRLSDGSSPKKAVYGLNTTSVSTRPVLGVDYSYRFTEIMGGVHTFGLRVTM